MSHTGQGTQPGQSYLWDGVKQYWGFASPCGTLLRAPTITAAMLQAALDSVALTADENHQRYLKVCGDVVLEDIVEGRSFVTVEFDSRITTTMAPAIGLADDPDNSLFYARGVELPAVLNTTLTVLGVPGAAFITVAALGTIAVGDYVVIRANCFTMGTDLSGAPSGNVDIYEIHRVAATAAAPNRIFFEDTLWNYFGASGAQPAIVRAVDPIRRFEMVGGLLDCSGGTIADGVSSLYALEMECIGQQAVGFSRSALELGPGTQHWLVEDFTRLGETNADIFTRASHAGVIRNYGYRPGLRQHANGLPRGNITMRNRSNDNSIENCMIGGGNIGILIWGGFDLYIDATARDCDPTARIARSNSDGGTAGTVGAALQTGVEDLNIVDYPFGMHVKSLVVGECVTVGNPGYAVYIEDVRQGVFDSIHVMNLGETGAMNGVILSDCKDSVFGIIMVRGCERAVTWENGAYSTTIASIEIQPQGGSGTPSAVAPLYLNLGLACIIRVERVKTADWGGFVEFGNSYPATNVFGISHLYGIGLETIDELYAVANGTTGTLANGEVVELDAATAGRVVDPGVGGAPNRCLTLVRGSAEDTATMDHLMVAVTKPGRRSMVRGASNPAGISPGNPLRHGLNGEAIADAAASADSLGVALTALAPNTAGLVQTG